MKQKINPLELDLQLCFSLYSASKLMTQAYDPLLKELDLTYPQYLVMLVLWETDNIAVKDIGERIKLDSGTLSPLLKKLQAKGYIEKERLEIDERIVAVKLTEEGKELKKKAVKVPNEMYCKLSMKDKDFVELRDKLKDLIKILEK